MYGLCDSWHCEYTDVELLKRGTLSAQQPMSTNFLRIEDEYSRYLGRFLENMEQERANIFHKMDKLHSENRELSKQLSTIAVLTKSKKSKFTSPTFATDYKGLLRSCVERYYDDFKFRGAWITGVTKSVTLKWHKPENGIFNLEIPLGKYDIAVNQASGDIVITVNGDWISHEDSYIHPHVNNGKPCLGSYSEDVAKAMAENNYFQVFMLIGDFINSFYEHGWYRNVLAFLPSEQREKYCFDCCHAIDTCGCREHNDETCSTCGENYDDCRCYNCPESGDTLEDGAFPDSGCSGCRHLSRVVRTDENGGDYFECTHGDGGMTQLCRRVPLILEVNPNMVVDEEGNPVNQEQQEGVENVS